MGRRWACKVRYEAPVGRNEEPEHPENGPGAENTPETPPVTTRKTQTILVQIILSSDDVPAGNGDTALVDNTAAKGSPTIDGTAEVDQTLTAFTTGIMDIDGLQNVAFTYQWLADDVEITGATNSTYTVDSGDEGKTIKVRVEFTDDAGNEESLTSAATAAVATAALALQSATIDGSTLTLTYNATLDVGVALSKSAFTVNVNEAERNIFIVGLGGTSVLLTLSTAVETGDTVTLAYTKPSGTNVIKDSQGREADSFTAQAVTNNTASAGTSKSDPVQAPGSLNVVRPESGKLKASWVTPGSGPTPTGYTVQWKESGDDWAVEADVSEANVKGTSHVITGLTDGTEYAVRVMARKGDDDSDLTAEVTATSQETLPPTVSSASVDGATLTITFNESTGHRPRPRDKSATFAVSSGRSQPKCVESVSVSGSVVTLTLATAVSHGRRGDGGLHGPHGGVGGPAAGPGGQRRGLLHWTGSDQQHPRGSPADGQCVDGPGLTRRERRLHF